MLRLIPRYNWDYGFSECARAALASVAGRPAHRDTFADLFGAEPLWTTSGRSSLYAILKALNLRKGARIGVPLFCCPVVFDAIAAAGFSPEFVDIELDDYNISPAHVREKRTQLDAILAVHMFGHPSDIDAVSQAGGSVPIVEDCAQALFSRYKGRPTGVSSIASFFSFRSGKYISAGEGSVIVCLQRELRDRIRALIDQFARWRLVPALGHCLSTYLKSTLYRRPWYGIAGFPIGRKLDKAFNLSGKSGLSLRRIAAGDHAIISERIRSFETHICKQRENARYLLDTLDPGTIVLPCEQPGCKSNYYQFAIRFADSKEREWAADYLFRRGIDTARYLDGIGDLARAAYGYRGDCPNAELCSRSVLVIPHHYTLAQASLQNIAQRLNEVARVVSRGKRVSCVSAGR